MIRKKTRAFVIILFIVIIVIAFSAYYFSRTKNANNTQNVGTKKVIVNPAAGLSYEEAVAKFDDSFVYYLLYSIGASNLHESLFGDTPKIKFYIDEDVYNAEVINGKIKINKGEIEGEDIIIKTSTGEAVKMVMNKNYVSDSFKTGESSIELVAGKLELASKGYLKIYDELSS